MEYNGIKADGGIDQYTEGGDGAGPGAGGAGGSWFGLYNAGGKGGPARAWVQFRQDPNAEPPGTGEGDTTPPDTSALTATVTATPTSFSLTNIHGATDTD